MSDTQIPDAVGVNIMGMPAIYLEIDPAETPNGFELAVTRPGELAPFKRGHIAHGSGLLIIAPEIVEKLRGFIGSQIKAARQAAGQGRGPTG